MVSPEWRELHGWQRAQLVGATPQWYGLPTPLTLLDRVEVVIQCHGTLCASWLANSTVLLAKNGVFVVTPGAVVEEAILGYVRLTHGRCERAVETLALSGGSAQKFVNLAGFLW